MPLVCLLLPCGAIAQDDAPLIDLTMDDNGHGQLEFRIRPNGYFDGIMSAITFTVRWPASAGVALDTAVRCYPFQDVVPVNAVAVQTNGEWMYRTFNGFSLIMLADMGLAWEEGHEYPICTADNLVPGTTFELVNDAWTAANNRDYYASLGGSDRTGMLFPSMEPDVDIHTVDQGTGQLDVVLTPDGDFFGWVSDIDLTVRWPAGSGTTIGALIQNAEVAEYLPMHAVGTTVTAGGFNYQRFHGEGVKSIANAGDAWLAGEGIVLMSLPIFGSAQGLLIANDDWTVTNEAAYAIELNGAEHTGSVEGIAMNAPTAYADELTLVARPLADGFDLSMELPGKAAHTDLSLYNAAGQLLWSGSREHASGRVNMQAGTGAIPEGLYILSVRHGDRSLVKRIVR